MKPPTSGLQLGISCSKVVAETNDIGDGYSDIKIIAVEVAITAIISNRKEMDIRHNARVRVPETIAPGQTSIVSFNDASHLNRIRRCEMEVGEVRRKTSLLNCKSCIKISTMNVRTIRTHRL